jgi:hypothetical protein
MSECLYSDLSYPAFEAHAQYYIVISGPDWLYGIFFRIIWQTARFSEREIENNIYVCLLVLFKNISPSKKTQENIVINVQISFCKVPVILVRF